RARSSDKRCAARVAEISARSIALRRSRSARADQRGISEYSERAILQRQHLSAHRISLAFGCYMGISRLMKKIVAVFGPSTCPMNDALYADARVLGHSLAEAGFSV